MITRRSLVKSTAGLLAGGAAWLGLGRALGAAGEESARQPSGPQAEPAQRRDASRVPVETPNGSSLPWKWEDGFKTFHLTAEPVRREFTPGFVVDCWGYNGQTPGPTIEAIEGDRVRVYVTNRLPEPTTVHWHGVLLPNGMDGVAGLTQRAIDPGETFKYEFTLRQHGTQMYHPHHDEMTQMAMGMQGILVIHPREPAEPPVDRDFAFMLSEWAIKPGASKPDPNEMTDFNILTLNSRVFPGTAPLVVRKGQRVRLRLANLSAMDAHPIHLHGFHFQVTGTDAGTVPPSARWPETTVLVPVGATRDVEFVADVLGDWALHCHITHHVMNQMGHGLPNVMGIDDAGFQERLDRLVPGTMLMGQRGMGEPMDMGKPRNSIPMQGGDGSFGIITMGGMFTILKVREGITSYEDPGWYEHPKGTVAEAVK